MLFWGKTEVRGEEALGIAWGSCRCKPVQPRKSGTYLEGLQWAFCGLGAEQKCGERWLWLLCGGVAVANLWLYGGRGAM